MLCWTGKSIISCVYWNVLCVEAVNVYIIRTSYFCHIGECEIACIIFHFVSHIWNWLRTIEYSIIMNILFFSSNKNHPNIEWKNPNKNIHIFFEVVHRFSHTVCSMWCNQINRMQIKSYWNRIVGFPSWIFIHPKTLSIEKLLLIILNTYTRTHKNHLHTQKQHLPIRSFWKPTIDIQSTEWKKKKQQINNTSKRAFSIFCFDEWCFCATATIKSNSTFMKTRPDDLWNWASIKPSWTFFFTSKQHTFSNWNQRIKSE